MLGKTKAIVLHSIKHGESGRIIKLYTENYGLISVIVKQTQSKSKGSTAALYQPLTILDMDLDVRAERGLQRVVSSSLNRGDAAYLHDPIKNCLAIFLAELFFRTVHEGEISVELFALLEDTVIKLCEQESVSTLPLEFMLDLADSYGIYPDMSTKGPILDLREGVFTNDPPGHKEVLTGPVLTLLREHQTIGSEESTIQLNKAVRRELIEGMLLYFQIHIPHFRTVNSYSVIREVFLA